MNLVHKDVEEFPGYAIGGSSYTPFFISSYAPQKENSHVNNEGRSRSHGGDICRIRSVFA
jgi:hypothetical protein